jgi:hypothetical protein
MILEAPPRLPAISGHVPAGPGGPAALSGAERLLWEATERALRQPKDRMALVLHLSRLLPPAPRAHHIRVARVLLQDSASRFGGQVFTMRNQDLVLLCTRSGHVQQGASRASLVQTSEPPPAGPAAEAMPAPETLPGTLARLFSADVPDDGRLTSLWELDRDASALLAYAAACAAMPEYPTAAEEAPEGLLSLTALQQILARAPLSELMVQQTGMLLGGDRGRSLAERLVPAFRDLELSLSALNLRPLVAQATGDPFLFRHLASGLDAGLIQLLSDDLAAKGRLTRPAVEAGLPIHMDLGLEAILSPAFARLSRQAAESGVRFGAAVSVMQACADLDLMEHARRVLQLTGGALILNRVDPAALAIITPAALQPDLLKLMWSPVLLGDGGHEPARNRGGVLAGFDPARTVLQGVDSQLALAWGQARGITLFQGPFLDQAQAASRMARCHSASACTLRQCCTRGSAVGMPGRAGCGNPALLDSGFGLTR